MSNHPRSCTCACCCREIQREREREELRSDVYHRREWRKAGYTNEEYDRRHNGPAYQNYD